MIKFKQASTWRGVLGLIAVVGYTIAPEILDAIAVILATSFSLIEMIRDEDK